VGKIGRLSPFPLFFHNPSPKHEIKIAALTSPDKKKKLVYLYTVSQPTREETGEKMAETTNGPCGLSPETNDRNRGPAGRSICLKSRVLNLEHSNFEFVSDFGFRASDLFLI
jgi:hypothetical protein